VVLAWVRIEGGAFNGSFRLSGGYGLPSVAEPPGLKSQNPWQIGVQAQARTWNQTAGAIDGTAISVRSLICSLPGSAVKSISVSTWLNPPAGSGGNRRNR
jgi:hypothetical protein